MSLRTFPLRLNYRLPPWREFDFRRKKGRASSLILALAYAGGNHYKNAMSEKKRTTVTIIETREVWIIQKVVPDPAEEAVVIATSETAREHSNAAESNEPNKDEET